MPKDNDEKVCVRMKGLITVRLYNQLIPKIICLFLVQFCMDIIQKFCRVGSPPIVKRAGKR